MTDQTPLERASDALYDFGIKDSWMAAQVAFASIDTNELAEAIHGDQCPEDPDPGDYCTCDGAHYDRLALAVKNWLTGKDTQ